MHHTHKLSLPLLFFLSIMDVTDEYIIRQIFCREDPGPFLQHGTTSVITVMIVLGPSMSPTHSLPSVLPFFLLTFTSSQQAEVKYGTGCNIKASINADKVMSPCRRRSLSSICKYNRSFQHCCSHQQARRKRLRGICVDGTIAG